MHGRLSAVYHNDSPLFAEIPQGFTVVRYHSLCITEPLPEDLEAIAWTDDGVVMGAAHRKRPVWGVQFHPESICTDWGRRLLANFRDLTAGVTGGKRTPLTQPASNGDGKTWSPPQRPRLRLQVERIDRLYDTEQVFVDLYGDHRYAFWLDSSMVDERSRFSFMGASAGPLSSVVTYDVTTGKVKVARGLVERGARGVDLRLPQPRAEAAALPVRRPALRLQLRLRRLLRLRAEGRLRGRQRPTSSVAARRGVHVRRPPDRRSTTTRRPPTCSA